MQHKSMQAVPRGVHDQLLDVGICSLGMSLHGRVRRSLSTYRWNHQRRFLELVGDRQLGFLRQVRSVKHINAVDMTRRDTIAKRIANP